MLTAPMFNIRVLWSGSLRGPEVKSIHLPISVPGMLAEEHSAVRMPASFFPM